MCVYDSSVDLSESITILTRSKLSHIFSALHNVFHDQISLPCS